MPNTIYCNFFNRFRALGRNFILSTPGYGHHNAWFELDSRIPPVHASSKLAVRLSRSHMESKQHFEFWKFVKSCTKPMLAARIVLQNGQETFCLRSLLNMFKICVLVS